MAYVSCIDSRTLLYPVTIRDSYKSPSILIRPKDPFVKKQSQSSFHTHKKVALLQRTAALCVPCSSYISVSYKGRPVKSCCVARYVYHRTYSYGI